MFGLLWYFLSCLNVFVSSLANTSALAGRRERLTGGWQALLLRCSGERPRLNLILNLPRDSAWALDYSSARLVCCTFTLIFDNCLVRDPSPILRVSRLVLSHEEHVSECGNGSHRFIRSLGETNEIGWFELYRKQTFISVVMPVTLATIEQPGSGSADHGGVLIGKSSRSSCPCKPSVSRRSTRSSSEKTFTRSTWNLV